MYSQALESKLEMVQVWNSARGQAWLSDYINDGLPGSTRPMIAELTKAYPYFVEPNICNLIQKASEGLIQTTLSEDLFLTKDGWVALDIPIILNISTDGLGRQDNDPINMKYFAWHVFKEEEKDEALNDEEKIDFYFSCYEQRFGRIYPFMFLGGKFNETFAAGSMTFTRIGEFDVELEEIHGKEHETEAAQELTKTWLVSFFLFIKQSLLGISHRQVTRATKRRIEHKNLSEIGVVILRTKHYKPSGEEVDVEWSCQWLVRGHWRQQPYPSEGIYRPIWIEPYIKGPEDKPMKNPEKIFDVKR